MGKVAAKRDVVGTIAAVKTRATRTKLPVSRQYQCYGRGGEVNATRTLLAATGSTSGTVAAAQAVAKQTTLAANSNPRGTVATVGEIRPPLKWAGGKRWLVPRLRELYAPYRNRRLVEPLCGGLAVALGLQPQRALLNDISPHASNFYRRLKAGFSIALEMRNDERLYYRHRERFNLLVAQGAAESLEAAALFYFLNRTGYNGLCRFNSRGEFNVPFGRYTTINYVRDFACYRGAFARWAFSGKNCAASATAVAGRLRVRGSALRRGLHALRQGGLRMGRSGAARRLPRGAWGAGSALEPGDRADDRRIVRAARLRAQLYPGAATDRLQGSKTRA